MRGRWTVCLLALLLAACNMAVPQVTPTVAPTLTASATLFVTSTPTMALTATQPATDTIAPSATLTTTDIPTETPSATLPPTETSTASATNTGTASPTLTPTASETPTETYTPSATNTGTATATEPLTPSATASDAPSDTPAPSPTASSTATDAPTETPTSTQTATETTLPTETPSATFSPTPLPSETFTPSATATDAATETLTPTSTRTPAEVVVVPTQMPTFTAVPSNTLPPSLTPPPPPTPLPLPGTPLFPTPTQEVAPIGVREPTAELVTAAPGTEAAPVTPIEAGGTPEPPTLTALPAIPTLAPLVPTSLPTFSNDPLLVPNEPLTRAFELNTDGVSFSSSELLLPSGFGATTFARNPLDPNSYAVVDARGLLYLFNGGLSAEQGTLLRTSPFAEPEPPNREANNAIVTQVGWSPDGQYLALLVDAEKDDRDGIWLLPNGQGARQIFRECPPPVQNVCTVVIGGEPNRYTSLRFEWNASSSAVLNTLFLPDENRRAFTVVPLGNDPTNIPPILRYDYATWSQDGSRVLVSGASADGRVGLRWVDPARGSAETILDGSAVGLWVQDAVERRDGQIVALGSPNGPGSAQSLYNASGQAISGQIGTGAPERVAWSPDRSAVLVVVNDTSNPAGAVRRYYVAQVDGTISEITGQVAGALAVEWLSSAPLPLTPTVPPSPTLEPTSAATIAPVGEVAPVGAAQGESAYGIRVNQQVQVIAPAGIYLRAQPSQSAVQVQLLNYFEYVVTISGPRAAEGLLWWQVQTATGQLGWVAEAVGEFQLLSVEPL